MRTLDVNDFIRVDLPTRRVHHKCGTSVVFPAYTSQADWDRSDTARIDEVDHYDGDPRELIAVAKVVARAAGMRYC
jgi:hypothetical protein